MKLSWMGSSLQFAVSGLKEGCSRTNRDSRVRFLKFFQVGLFAGATAVLLIFQIAIARAQEDEPAAGTEENVTEPPRELRNFFPRESRTPAPSPAPAPQSSTPPPSETPEEETSERTNFGVGKFSRLPFHLESSERVGYDDNVLLVGNKGRASAFIGS